MRFPEVLVFGLEISSYIILPNFQGRSFVLTRISRGTEKNKKNSRDFFKKVMCSPPPPPPPPPPPSSLFGFLSGITQSKIIDLNRSCEALAQKEGLTVCQDRAFASFPCVLSLSSVLGRFTHLYCDTSSLG